jgi:hypothetical protein
MRPPARHDLDTARHVIPRDARPVQDALQRGLGDPELGSCHAFADPEPGQEGPEILQGATLVGRGFLVCFRYLMPGVLSHV